MKREMFSTIKNGVLIKFDEKDLKNGFYNIPDSVTSIGVSAFSGCISLTSINIPDSVTSIGDYAFSRCRNLTSINIPDSVTSIGDYAFQWCENLTSINIPDSVTSIGNFAFLWCENLTSISIPDSVNSIGDRAFSGCENLTSINIPDSVTSIGNSALQWCRKLTSINIPNSVTSIGVSAFSGCISLTSINIPDSVTSIGVSAFSGCISLTSINIPDSVTSIGNSAFETCKNLTSINIPDSVTSIGNHAFFGCSNLTSISIPDSVASIGISAFSECSRLKTLQLPKKLATGLIASPLTQLRTENNANYSGLVALEQINQQTNISQVEKLLKHPEFEQLRDSQDLFNLLYNLGLFENKEKKLTLLNDQGKKTEQPVSAIGFNIIQKMFSFENDDSKLQPENIHLRFQSMQPVGVNEEFLKFLSNKTNLNAIIQQEKNQTGFISKVLDWFEHRKSLDNLQDIEDSAGASTYPTSEENRYKIRTYATTSTGIDKIKWLSPTVELLRKEFKEQKFSGVTKETKELADFIRDYDLYEQRHFEKAVSIDKERQTNGVPDHILGEELNQTYTDSFKQYLSRTELLHNEILNNASEVVQTQADFADNIFTYEMLSKSSKANFVMGFLTSCCATLYGAGGGAMRAMIIDGNMQPLVIRNRKGDIVAFGIVYVNKKEGYAVVNDVEVNQKYKSNDEARKLIYDKFKEGIEAFVSKYNKKYDTPIKQVNIGISPNWEAVNDFIRKNPKSPDILHAPNFNDFKYAGSGSWPGDWHKEQYILYKEESNNKE